MEPKKEFEIYWPYVSFSLFGFCFGISLCTIEDGNRDGEDMAVELEDSSLESGLCGSSDPWLREIIDGYEQRKSVG